MPAEFRIDESRRFAATEVKRILGISQLTQDALFELASNVLGENRACRCLEFARFAPLTRRQVPVSAVAMLIVGTRALGSDWWTRGHEDLVIGSGWVTRATPDSLLASGHDLHSNPEHGGSCLGTLGDWIADDSADDRWGRPTDYVDLNDPRANDRVRLPSGAQPGDRLVATFDHGGRVWVEVVQHKDPPEAAAEAQGFRRGPLGSCLREHAYIDVAEAGWAWSIATDCGPIRLPGEKIGEPSDPFLPAIDVGVASRLHDWAIDHGATADQLGPIWRTKGDLWSARFGLGLPYSRRPPWHAFDRAVSCVVDGDTDRLASALEALSPS